MNIIMIRLFDNSLEHRQIANILGFPGYAAARGPWMIFQIHAA